MLNKRGFQRIERVYGLSKDEYLHLFDSQGGGCAICKTTDRQLVVDHCHTTNQVRGLLCYTCNLGLGTYKDNPKFMLAAMNYLQTKPFKKMPTKKSKRRKKKRKEKKKKTIKFEKQPKVWRRKNHGNKYYVCIERKQIFVADADATEEEVQSNLNVILLGETSVRRKTRIPKPWRRKSHNNDWYICFRQRQYFLAPADATEEQLQKAMASFLMEINVETKGMDGLLLPLFGRFLTHVQKDQAVHTYNMRRKDIQSFSNYLKSVGLLEKLTVKELQPFHITQWLDSNTQWGPSTKRVAINSLMSCLNWCREQGYIDTNPLSGRIKRPPKRSRGREVYIDEDTYKMWLGFCRHPHQKYILIAMYRTGCRPGEVMGLCKDDGTSFDEVRGTWTVLGKRTRKNPTGLRTIAIDPLIIGLSKKLKEKNPSGALFRNCRGKPWEGQLVGQMLRRFRKWSIEHHPEKEEYYKKLIPYGFRHTWATNRLIEGESDVLVAIHLGHEGTAILHEHYNHVLANEVKPIIDKLPTFEGENI